MLQGMAEQNATAVLTPMRGKKAVELASGIFRKQVLPNASINYTGPGGARRKLSFDAKYRADLVSAFRSGAFDQVPFQLADGANTHTNDPERTRGEIVGIEDTPDGLYALVKPLTDEAATLLRNNPKLGVSARIIENYQRADGKFFPRALQHVLGTLDPQIAGMKPWQEVDMSSPATDSTIDLSGNNYERTATMSGTETSGGTENGQVTLTLDREQADRLALLLNDDQAAAAALAGAIGLANVIEPGQTDDDALDGLSPEVAAAIEMANAQAEAANQRVTEMARQLAAAQVAGEIDRYNQAGLAPAIIEAARPLLTVQTGSINLSNGADQVDPGEVIRQVLDTVIGLSNNGLDVIGLGRETGSLVGSEQDPREQDRNEMLNEWAAKYGN